MNIKIFNFKSISIFLTSTVAGVSLILFQLPLVSTFGYEFAIILAFLFFLLSGFVNLWRLKKNIPSKDYFKFSFIVLLVPIFVAILISFTKDICSFWFGVSFYLTVTTVSYILSFFISEIIYQSFSKFHKIIFLTVIIVIIFIPVYEIYFNPQVYFYSPIIGYFPGTLYDEELNISLSLILYRLFNLFYFGIFYLVVKRNLIKNKSLSIILFGIIAILFLWFSPELGFSTSRSKLEKVLSGKIDSENFIIQYDKEILDSTEIKILLLNYEYYFAKLKQQLGFSPAGKITSFIFSDRKQKKKFFGSEQADIAKPWLNEIYISKDSYEATLNHELVHIFSAEIGKGIFRLADSFNPALIEGFAEAIDNSYDDIDLHTLASSAYHYEYKIHIPDLFSGLNFFRSFSGLSYLYAGSFSKYLIEKYGLGSFSVFYHSGDSRKAFGKTLDELSNNYYDFLKNQNISLFKNQIQYYFGRSSIFQKVCPRQIAYDLKEAEDLIIQKKFSEAEKVLKRILDKTPNYSAIAGLINIYIEQKNYTQAKSLIDNYIKEFQETPYYYLLKFLNGDVNLLIGNDSLALFDYRYIINSNPHIQLKLIAELRIELQKKTMLKNYLENIDSVKFQILVKINRDRLLMSSILSMISLAEKNKIQPKVLLEVFHSPLIPASVEDAYVLYRFSKYLLKNNDFINARKLASLANRKSFDSVYYFAIKEQFEKCNWFIKNYERVINLEENQ